MIILKIFVMFMFFNISCEGHKILVIFPVPSKSHCQLGDNIVKHLLDAGHEVTYITPFVKKNVSPNLHQIDVTDNNQVFDENTMHIQKMMDKVTSLRNFNGLSNLTTNIAKHTFKNPNTMKLMRDTTQKFDAVISQWLFTELYAVFSTIFDCPLIWFSTIEPHWVILNLVDGPLNPAYSTSYFSSNIPPLSFIERVQELWVRIEGMINRNFIHYYFEVNVYQELLVPLLEERGKKVPSYDEIQFNASLILGNSNVFIGDGHSVPPNYIHIGGFHIDDDVIPLPKDIQNIMDNSEHGVIYFSMGSNIKSKTLPVQVKEGLLKVLGELKQTVIWKFEDVLPNIPKNVHIVSWAPQQSILAHPNVVVFITHGGIQSITEAVYFGVPVITIPVFVDQFANANRAQKKGFGKNVDLTYTMHKNLRTAIKDVLSNSKYSEKAKEISRAYHKNPVKPKDALKAWVNHVIETHGAPHLRSPGLSLKLYQRLYLDLIAVILIIVILFFFTVKHVLRLNKDKKKEKVISKIN